MSIPGLMEDNMMENGFTIICMGMAFIHGKMEGDMKDNIKTIKNMGLGYSNLI